MLKLIAAIRRKPGLTHEDCVSYLATTHARLARAKPLGVRKYVQSFVFDGAYGAPDSDRHPAAAFRDSVTELWFTSMEEMGRTFADPYTREVIGPDGRNFSDLAAAIGLLTRETVLIPPKVAKTAIKVMQFLRLNDGIAVQQLEASWLRWHEAALAGDKSLRKAIKGFAYGVRTPEGDPFTAYFGGREASDYHGVGSLWFDSAKALPLFRAYHHAFMRAALVDEIVDQAQSFYVYARENVVIDVR